MIKHGRESLVKIADGKFVSKEPLPGRSMSQKREWLSRQQHAADTIQKLHKIGNNAYGVPHIKSIDSKRFCVLEERVSGVPLTPLLFRGLDDHAREKVIDSLAQFYADMHSIDVIPNPIEYKMECGLDVKYLEDFLEDVDQYFSKKEIKSVRDEIKFIDKVYQHIINTSYETRIVWVHGDLFEDNVLYDFKAKKFNVIDFTDVGTSFLHYDMLRSYAYDLGVADAVRTRYLNYRDARYLPEDFVDDARWKQIAQYHNVANVLEQMNEEVTDVQYLGKNERAKMLNRLKQQINMLHKYARAF